MCAAQSINIGNPSLIFEDVWTAKSSKERFTCSTKLFQKNRRCSIQCLEAKAAGTATKLGLRGADWWLKTFRRLPGYYIAESEATQLGWIPILANLSIVAPGKMLTKGVYKNRDKRLPDAPERVWYEADINYSSGYRGGERVLYSNDGLIFATYDYYATFVEIV